MCVIGPTWPFRGGIAHYTTLLVKHLRERHTVRFITYIKQYPKWLYPGNTAMDPSPDSSVLRIECDRLLTPWNPLTWWRTYRLIKRDQPDVLLLQWWTPFFSPMLFFLTRMLKHETRIRVIFLCHHLIAPDGGIFDWFLARRILWRGNGFIVMSEEDFALLRRALPWARIKGTTHPPYDVFSRAPIPREQARAKLGLPLDAPVVLFFGFVRRYKGLRHLIEAMRIVRDRLPDAKLLVVGEFWEDERPYHDLIRQLGLQDAVQIYNQYIPNDQITVYFSAADAVALPYLEATQSGVAQLAIGFERPIIATNVGGMAEVVHHGETGFVVPPGDSQALAAALIEFFTKGFAETFSQRIRKDKESASWLPMIQLIEELAQPLPEAQAEAVAIRRPSPRVF
ncbi:MAG: glycosyltransferase [Anaerolineae bacterium]|nr:glycosyltransferase [Candidatus Roseilinea sp.]MDW8451124.1 glycosyltransferase [Anaerolineae bacterium]